MARSSAGGALTVVIAEAELELVPEAIRSHPAVIASAERAKLPPDRLLLESTHHHKAMWGLADGKRRGRPDILHVCLLVALHSVANACDRLRVLVHTRNDRVVLVDRYTRVPKDYERFAGLMRQLLAEGAVPPQQPLLTLEPLTLDALIARERPSQVFVLSRRGAPIHPRALGRALAGEPRPMVLIGGFPEGGFARPPRGGERVVSIFGSGLPAWTVLATVLAAYEDAAGLYGGGA